MSTIPFFLFILLITIGHYFSYLLIINAFPKLKKRKIIVLLFLILITVMFLASFICLNFFQNIWLMITYFLFAVLFGLLTQLMFFGGLFFIRKMVLKFWSFARRNCIFPDPKSPARFLLVFVVIFFLLGTYNAFFPRVKTIVLPAFSEKTKGRSFVHLSDLHLGAIYRPAWLQMITEKVNRLEADFVVISGDLFDGTDKNLSEFIAPLSLFTKPTIFVSGNHDSYIFASEVEKVIKDAGLIDLNDKALELSGIELVGFAYLGDDDENNLPPNIENLDLEEKRTPRIIINHVPVKQAEAYDLRADLMLMGHAHRGQIFPFSLVTKLTYASYAYGLSSYQEMITYTSAGTGTWGPPLRTLFPGEIILFKFE